MTRRTLMALVILATVALVFQTSQAAKYRPVKRWMTVTAYCTCKKCCGPNAKGITASGKRARGKMIAAPRTYAFGTVMYVPGYGTSCVEDRGGAIKGSRLDLLFPSHKAALKWGKKRLLVTIWVRRR